MGISETPSVTEEREEPQDPVNPADPAVTQNCFVRLGDNYYPPQLEVILPRRICYSSITIDFRAGGEGNLILIGDPFSDRLPFNLVIVNNAVEVRSTLRSGRLTYRDENWSYQVQLRARLHSGGKVDSVRVWVFGDIHSPRGPERFDQEYSPSESLDIVPRTLPDSPEDPI